MAIAKGALNFSSTDREGTDFEASLAFGFGPWGSVLSNRVGPRIVTRDRKGEQSGKSQKGGSR